MFSYEGLGTGVQEFILTVYGTRMPMLNLNRRKGCQDIELLSGARCKPEEGPINLRMEFPIRTSLTLQLIQCRGIKMRNVPCHLNHPPRCQPGTFLIVDTEMNSCADANGVRRKLAAPEWYSPGNPAIPWLTSSGRLPAGSFRHSASAACMRTLSSCMDSPQGCDHLQCRSPACDASLLRFPSAYR